MMENPVNFSLDWLRERLGLKTRVALAFSSMPLATDAAVSTKEPVAQVRSYERPQPQETVAFDFAQLPADTIKPLTEAVRQIRHVCGEDHERHPAKVQGTSLLHEGRPGISRAEDGALVISYTFGHSRNIASYQAKVDEGYKDYRSFNADERAAFLVVLRHYEETANVRFVEAETPESAYFSTAVFDLSSQTNFYNGEDVKVGGQCDFPNTNGAVLMITPGYSGTGLMHLLTHEMGHGFGMRHPHEFWDFQKQYNSYNFTQMSYEGGSNELLGGGGGGYTTTLQEGDVAFLQENYGKPAPRAPKMFVVDSTEFRGMLQTQPDDTLKITHAPSGIVDLRGGVENPSRLGDSRIWVSESLTNLQIENSSQLVVTGSDSTHVAIHGDSAATVVTYGTSLIQTGGGADKIVASCPHSITHIEGFTPGKDTLLYSTSVTRHELLSDGKGGTVVQLYEGEAQAGQIHCYGVKPDAMVHATLRPIAESERQGIINGKRPFIYLEPGDNGLMTNYDPWFHTLQFNSDTTIGRPSSRIHTDGVNTSVTLTNVYGDIASFTLPGVQDPEMIRITHNGSEVKCIEGFHVSADSVATRWTSAAGFNISTRLTDLRHSSRDQYALESDDIVVTGNHAHRIPVAAEETGGYVHVADSASVTMRFMKGARRAGMSQFRTDRDKIETLADSVSAINLGDNRLGLILWNGSAKPGMCVIENFTGDLADIKCTSVWNRDSNGNLLTVPIVKTSMGARDNGMRNRLWYFAESVADQGKLAKEQFPDLENPSPAWEHTTPASKKGGRGRN